MSNIKLLTFTSLYPNAEHPRHGIFVENRLRHLIDSGQVESLVVAPVPWFPFPGTIFGNYGRYSKVPKHENRHGIDVLHPRYPVLPKIGMTMAPFLMACFLLPVLNKIIKNYPFDIIDAHYFYPDGVAAVIFSKIFKKPVVITGRGTDINCIPHYYFPKKMIQWAASHSNHNIVVSNSLKKELLKIGINGEKITNIENGVDIKIFNKKYNKKFYKEKLKLEKLVILSVGNLVKNKGHNIIIQAIANLNNVQLVIVGEGSEEYNLRRMVKDHDIENRVKFIKYLDQISLSEYYNAADAFVLASEYEGCPNVILESLACGTPVVSTNVGNVHELAKTGKNIYIFKRSNTEELVNILSFIISDENHTNDNILSTDKFSWNTTVEKQIKIYDKIKDK